MAHLNIRKKRIYVVNRDFQFRYTWAAVLVAFVSTCLTLALILVPLYMFEILRIPRFLPPPFLLSMVAAVVLNMVLIASLGIIVTHRIAGPMFNLTRALRRVELGRWAGHMRVRDTDELKYIARGFNQMVDGLMAQGKNDLCKIEAALKAVEENKLDVVRSEILALGESLRDRLRTEAKP